MGLVLYRCCGYIGASVIQGVVGIWGLVLYRVLWVYGVYRVLWVYEG